ncbi:Putative biopolymer transport protein ExbD [Halomicronema hongdechloris C2206]|uniref:Biopolymer transport protein ExbD n=1 Tax=Halomicronema hongdechloris C2206 TaxID=1641165 RepID=A0A1Z3HU01_9CYAN|nr:biopolymer transporter ExbD [Halomicronema hongdechloris]ASC73784.1 Putative biopolymer transport protein ExbD [Halomicronema hongdechloris C2206]
MRFRQRQMRWPKAGRRPSQVPEVNLVPMMDVLMTVLTFFIIISMSLTGQQLLNVRLPQILGEADELVEDETNVRLEALIVGLDASGALLLDNEPVAFSRVAQRIRTYFQEHPDGRVILKADRSLSYEQVATLLTDLRDIGGNRVSLAVE